jgi:hypothetical protein
MKIDLNDYSKKINPQTGRFLKNHIPHNKGKKWSEWMDWRKQKRILKNLQRKGNPNLAGSNARKVVGVKNGKFFVFDSGVDAGRKLGIQARNINSCCHKKRKTCGGIMWFFEDDNEWIKLIEK